MSFGLFVYCVSNAMIAESIWQDKCRAYNLMYVILPLLLLLPPPSPPSPPLMLCFYLNFYMSFPCTKQIYGTRRANIHPTKQPTSFCQRAFLFLFLLLRWWIYSLISVDLQPLLSAIFLFFFGRFSSGTWYSKFHMCAVWETDKKTDASLFLVLIVSHAQRTHPG